MTPTTRSDMDRPETIELATTLGAVLGPVLLASTDILGIALGLPALGGPYLLAGAAFAAATVVLLAGLPTGAPLLSTTSSVTAPPSRLGRDGALGLAVLSTGNVVMVAVMTMAPVLLHHLGHGLGAIGVVISLHVAAVFAPSPLSGRLTHRVGTHRAATAAGCLLLAASGLAAAGAGSLPALGAAMVVLGAAWNLALISGRVLLTTGVPAAARPRREGGARSAWAWPPPAAASPLVPSSPRVATSLRPWPEPSPLLSFCPPLWLRRCDRPRVHPPAEGSATGAGEEACSPEVVTLSPWSVTHHPLRQYAITPRVPGEHHERPPRPGGSPGAAQL